MTGDPDRIEKVLERVDSLVLDLETTRFDPYDSSCRYNFWIQYTIYIYIYNTGM